MLWSLAEDFARRPLSAVLVGFGVGLSWGASAITTDRIYAPSVLKFEETA